MPRCSSFVLSTATGSGAGCWRPGTPSLFLVGGGGGGGGMASAYITLPSSPEDGGARDARSPPAPVTSAQGRFSSAGEPEVVAPASPPVDSVPRRRLARGRSDDGRGLGPDRALRRHRWRHRGGRAGHRGGSGPGPGRARAATAPFVRPSCAISRFPSTTPEGAPRRLAQRDVLGSGGRPGGALPGRSRRSKTGTMRGSSTRSSAPFASPLPARRTAPGRRHDHGHLHAARQAKLLIAIAFVTRAQRSIRLFRCSMRTS